MIYKYIYLYKCFVSRTLIKLNLSMSPEDIIECLRSRVENLNNTTADV